MITLYVEIKEISHIGGIINENIRNVLFKINVLVSFSNAWSFIFIINL